MENCSSKNETSPPDCPKFRFRQQSPLRSGEEALWCDVELRGKRPTQVPVSWIPQACGGPGQATLDQSFSWMRKCLGTTFDRLREKRAASSAQQLGPAVKAADEPGWRAWLVLSTCLTSRLTKFRTPRDQKKPSHNSTGHDVQGHPPTENRWQ